jgi:ribonuclease BN (tRNA processing enzyme)
MKTFEEFLEEETISTNDKTISQLVDIAKKLGVKVTVNTHQSLARQKQQVVDAIRQAGHKISNTMATKLQ